MNNRVVKKAKKGMEKKFFVFPAKPKIQKVEKGKERLTDFVTTANTQRKQTNKQTNKHGDIQRHPRGTHCHRLVPGHHDE